MVRIEKTNVTNVNPFQTTEVNNNQTANTTTNTATTQNKTSAELGNGVDEESEYNAGTIATNTSSKNTATDNKTQNSSSTSESTTDSTNIDNELKNIPNDASGVQKLKALLVQEKSAKSTNDQKLIQLNARLDELQQNLNAKKSEEKQTEEDLKTEQDNYNNLQKQLEEAQGNIENQQKKYTSQVENAQQKAQTEYASSDRSTSLEAFTKKYTGAVDSSAISDSKNLIQTLSAKLETSANNIKSLQNKINSLNSDISNLSNQVTSAKSDISKVEAENAKLENNINSINSKQSKVSAVGTGMVTGSVSMSDAQLTDSSMQGQLDEFKQHYAQNKSQYEAVAAGTGLPPELIAALHWREATGDFSATIRDGNSSVSDWVSDAINVLNSEGAGSSGLSSSSKDLGKCCEFAEEYNGLGYRHKGVVSPYVWSGTGRYSSGKYVADGVYSASAKDQQLGVAVLMASIM